MLFACVAMGYNAATSKKGDQMKRSRFIAFLLFVTFVLTACGGGGIGTPEPLGYIRDVSGDIRDFDSFEVGAMVRESCELFDLVFTDEEADFSFHQQITNVTISEVPVNYQLTDSAVYHTWYRLPDERFYESVNFDDMRSAIRNHYSDLAFYSFLYFDYDVNSDEARISESVMEEILRRTDVGYRDSSYIYDYEQDYRDSYVYYTYNLIGEENCYYVLPVDIEIENGYLDYVDDSIYAFNDESNKFEIRITREEVHSMKAAEAVWVNQDPAEIRNFDGTFSYEYGSQNSNDFIKFLQELPATIYYSTNGSSATFGKIVFNK